MQLLLTIIGIIPFVLLGVFVFWIIAGVITMNRPQSNEARTPYTATTSKPNEQARPAKPIINMGDVYDVNHLPVNDTIVTAILRNPHITYEDCDALYFSLCNHPDYGGTHPLVDDVLRKQGEVYKKR